MQSMFKPITDFFTVIFEKILELVSGTGISDQGVVIVLSVFILTLLVRLAVLPFSIKAAKSTQKMQEIQPEVKKLQEKYKNDPEKQNMEIMKLYKERKVSMTGGCLPMLLPLPILMALYYVFWNMQNVKGTSFLFINDLSQTVMEAMKGGNYLILILPVLSALSTYLPSYLISKASPQGPDSGAPNMSGMNIGMSLMMGFMSLNFQCILILYWIMGGFIQLVQTYFINYRPAIQKRMAEEKAQEEADIASGKSRFAMPVESQKSNKKKKKK